MARLHAAMPASLDPRQSWLSSAAIDLVGRPATANRTAILIAALVLAGRNGAVARGDAGIARPAAELAVVGRDRSRRQAGHGQQDRDQNCPCPHAPPMPAMRFLRGAACLSYVSPLARVIWLLDRGGAGVWNATSSTDRLRM